MADWPTTGERPYGAKVKAYVDDKLPKDGTSAMTGALAVDRSGNAQITTRNSSAPADNRKWIQTVQSSDGRVTFDAYNDANAWVGTRFEILRSGGVVVDGIRHLKGSGSPEGAISGPVGSRYIDIAATNGAVEWVKFSGTGNTGWRVAYGDTGWRDVSAALTWDDTRTDAAKTRAMQMRRVGNTVEVGLTWTPPSGFATSWGAVASPLGWSASGWRPRSTTPAAFRHGNGETPTLGIVEFQTSGMFAVMMRTGWVTTGSYRASLTFTTTDNWPSTLPGTPA